MSGADWLVILGGLLLIAWVNWWFFVGDRGAATGATDDAGASRAARPAGRRSGIN